jgi:hypothetical protein
MQLKRLQELNHNVTLTDLFIDNKLGNPANLDEIKT